MKLFIVLMFILSMAGCSLLTGDPIIDRIKETNQDVYGCVNLDIAARGGRVNLILVPIGQPLPPDTKIPQC